MSKLCCGAAVHAAEPAGDEDADPGQRRQPHGRGDRGGAVAAARDHVRQVADAHLDDVAGGWRAARGRRRPARSRRAVEHGDGGRHRAGVADDALDLERHRDVLGVGHAVADDRALQRDHRAAGGQRLGDLVGEGQHRVGHRSICFLGRARRSAAWTGAREVGADGVGAGDGERGGRVAVRRARRPASSPAAGRGRTPRASRRRRRSRRRRVPARRRGSRRRRRLLSSEPRRAEPDPDRVDAARVQGAAAARSWRSCRRQVGERGELVAVGRDGEQRPVRVDEARRAPPAFGTLTGSSTTRTPAAVARSRARPRVAGARLPSSTTQPGAR